MQYREDEGCSMGGEEGCSKGGGGLQCLCDGTSEGRETGGEQCTLLYLLYCPVLYILYCNVMY